MGMNLHVSKKWKSLERLVGSPAVEESATNDRKGIDRVTTK